MSRQLVLLIVAVLFSRVLPARDIYLNAKAGNDHNSGDVRYPLKTIGEAARRVDTDESNDAITLILGEGVYPLMETAIFNNDKFSVENRLIIRAEIMPDDSSWNPQRMPIIAGVIEGTPTPKDGEEARGIEIEVSHVTIAGLRFTGSPVYYYMQGSQARRYYPIWRNGKNLDDLVITQCLFAGNVDVQPIRVGVIANGHGLVLDHCVFFNCQNPAVFWEAEGGTSYRNVMRYCLVYEANYSGVWTTSQTGNDLEFHHNIIANSRTAWIRDNNSMHQYQIHDCIFTNNMKNTGNGADRAVVDTFLSMENVQLSGVIEIEKDQSSRNYLQLKAGSFGSTLQAGLFKKR
jgi:hypothetical protein